MEAPLTERCRQRFEPVLASLAERLGMEPLTLEASGHFGFASDSGEAIYCQLVERAWADSLEVSISLAEAAPEAEALQLMLECNFAMYGSRDGWVALRPGMEDLWYFRRLGLERMTAEVLESALADFLETADYLREMLASAIKEAPVDEAPVPVDKINKDMGLRA